MFNVIGIDKVSESYIFSGNLQYLPRIGEHIKIYGKMYKISNIVYKPTFGNSSSVDVDIYMIPIN